MTDIVIEKLNDVYCKVECDKSISREISENYSFRIDNWRFHPKCKAGWDGVIRLYNHTKKTIYTGLIESLTGFAKEARYSIKVDDYYEPHPITDVEFMDFVKTLKLPFEPRDYQIKYALHSIRTRRALNISPTGSGKSLIAYLVIRYVLTQIKSKVIVLVPTTALVYQLISDFKDYGWDSAAECHGLCEGAEKTTNKRVIVSTWQSLQYMAVNKAVGKKKVNQYNPEWFEKFGCLIGDECHTFNATALKNISECLVNACWRIGLTGTLDGSTTNELVLTGIFGPKVQFKWTNELIADGTLSPFKINVLKINYPDEFKRLWHNRKKKVTYQEEIDFIVQYEKRNSMLAKLAVSRKGNSVVIFRYVEKQGRPLFEKIKKICEEKYPDRKVFFYAGEVPGEERNALRAIIEKEKDAIIVGSVQTISTGINIVNLHNIIFASPSKARIKILQSIGRALRKSEVDATLYDITDDLCWKSKKNYTALHLIERLKMYVSEKFDYKLKEIELTNV